MSNAIENIENTEAQSAPTAAPNKSIAEIMSCFKPLSQIPEEDAAWLIPGWMPEGQITLLAADGGSGKTSVWCSLVAAISNGSRCILDPADHTREPVKVMFLTTEDSIVSDHGRQHQEKAGTQAAPRRGKYAQHRRAGRRQL